MGEASELLEEMLDLGVPLDTRVFESDSSEMMNILTTNLSHSWNPEANEESPTRGSVRNIHPWGVDFQTQAHETSNDEPFATTPVGSIFSGTTHHCVQQHRNVRGEGGFRALTPPTSWPVPEAGVVETAFSGNCTGDKENGLNSGRRSTRFRKVTERFDPVNIDAEVCRVADVGRCAQKRDWKKDDVKVAGKRPKLEKMPSLKDKRGVDVNGHLTCNQQPAMRLPSHRAASSHAAKFFKQAAKGNANRGGRAGSSSKSSENAQMERGKHVGSKPQMQKTARAGQRRWKALLSKMRAETEIMPTSKNFGKQITEVGTGKCETERRIFFGGTSCKLTHRVRVVSLQCKRLKLKSQKEALLLFLHASARDGVSCNPQPPFSPHNLSSPPYKHIMQPQSQHQEPYNTLNPETFALALSGSFSTHFPLDFPFLLAAN